MMSLQKKNFFPLLLVLFVAFSAISCNTSSSQLNSKSSQEPINKVKENQPSSIIQNSSDKLNSNTSDDSKSNKENYSESIDVSLPDVITHFMLSF